VDHLPDIPQDAFERRLFELASDALVVCDVDGAIRRANPAAALLLMGDEHAPAGGVLWDIVHPDDVARVRSLFQRVDPHGRIREDEFRVRVVRAGGEVRWAEVRAVVDHDAELCHIVARDVTGREEAEARLAEAQQVARLGSWEWVPQGDRVTWSDELYRIHGLRPEAGVLTFAGHLERVHPDDRARVARTIEQGVEIGAPWNMDHRIVRPDGEVRLVHARGEVAMGAAGSSLAVHGTCQDVTEARKIEDALRATEQLFRRAFDDSPIGMALIDLDGRWLRLNRALAQLAGRTEADLRASSLAALSHPDDAEIDLPLIRELLAGRRRSYAIEKRMLHADGRVLHLLAHVSLMHGDGERPLYFLVQLIDLSERRRADAERRAGEQRLQAIIDNAPALISVKDARQRFLLVNRRFEEAMGVCADAVLGRTADEALPPARADAADDELEREVVRTGQMREVEVAITAAATGEDLELLRVKFPLLDTDGQIAAVCTIATDLTDRRRAERARTELEQRLAQAQRLESVGQLAGGVAHDFNNLLSVILSCVTFARDELADDSPVREDVDEIGRAAERAAALTRQLLMFSRREVVHPEVLDIAVLVRDLESLLSRSLGELVDLQITAAGDLPHVLADRSRLEQVLVNLAVNARDAMPQGGALRIAIDRAGDDVRVCVADEGVGMAPQVADRAFEPFFTTKPAGEGTGLGLATVHGIVTDSGGEVTIDSAPGSGTAVTFTLPAAREATERRDPQAGAADEAVAAPGSARVLVVEDQDPVRRQAVRILERHGYAVREAASGAEALEGWGEVDVLVTDVVMPGMTGHELAQQAAELVPGLPVVFMSGHTEDVVLLDGAREREIAFVQKPFTRESLLGAVSRALADGARSAA
jgi:PAS domain S-box-containing protein